MFGSRLDGDATLEAADALVSLAPPGSDRSQKSKFGRLLMRHTDKVFDGYKIVPKGKATSGPNKNVTLYQLEPVSIPQIGRHGRLGRHEPLPHVVVSEEKNLKQEKLENIQGSEPLEHVSQVSHVSRFNNAEDFEDAEDEEQII